MSTLDLLLLALVEEGLNTPYALKSAGLSVGATRPALARMEKQGWLKRGKRQAGRGKQEFAITSLGRAAFRRGLRSALRSSFSHTGFDVESLLRIVTLGIIGGRRREVLLLLRHSVRRWKEEAHKREKAAVDAPGRKPSNPAALYPWMRLVCDAARLRGESSALADLEAIARKL